MNPGPGRRHYVEIVATGYRFQVTDEHGQRIYLSSFFENRAVCMRVAKARFPHADHHTDAEPCGLAPLAKCAVRP